MSPPASPRRRAAPTLRLLPAAAVALAAAARADPSTDHFDALVATLNARELALPPDPSPAEAKQAAAIEKAFRILGGDADDAADDLRMAARLAPVIEKGFPGDAGLVGDLAAAVDGLGGEAEAERTLLEAALDTLAEGKLRDKAAKKLVAAEAALAAAGEEDRAKTRALLLRRAWLQAARGQVIAARAAPEPPEGSSFSATTGSEPFTSNGLFGPSVFGQATVAGDGAVRRLQVTGRMWFAKEGEDPPLPGEYRTLQITLAASALGPDVTAGTFPVGNADGLGVSAVYRIDLEDGSVRTFVAISGSVTIASLDVGPGDVDATGTFGLTVRDGVTGQTLAISGGSFDARGLPRVAP
jgi:hypothetical protein